MIIIYDVYAVIECGLVEVHRPVGKLIVVIL